MEKLDICGWSEALEIFSLREKERRSYAITIRWYLRYCKGRGLSVGIESGHQFLNDAKEQKQAADWMVKRWKDAMNWLYRYWNSREEAKRKGGQCELERSAGGSLDWIGKKEGLETEKPVIRGNVKQPAQLESAEPKWKLDLVKGVRIRQFSYTTEKTYMNWIERFAAYHKCHELEVLGVEEIKLYLDYIAVKKRVAVSTQRQALNALVFLYRDVYKRELGDFSDYKRGYQRRRLPVVLSEKELALLFAHIGERYRLMAKLQYGTGLRVSELARLRVKDVDFERGQIFVRSGKGDKDRVTFLPESLLPLLKSHLNDIRGLHESDRANGVAGVYLPEALARKYKNAGEQWPWFWFWPARNLSRDPRAGGLVRRHHLVQKTYQQVVSVAARQAKLNKRVSTHAFRHSFATHLLEAGGNICMVQELLGHESLDTTRIYLHVMGNGKLSLKSPADRLAEI